jgi:hypothetical protein
MRSWRGEQGQLPSQFHSVYNTAWGTRWRSWLRHFATSRKVASSIPDGVIEITKMSTRNISLGGGGGVKAAAA